MKYRELECETLNLHQKTKEQEKEIERLRKQLEQTRVVNYNNCTFNIIATKDAISTIQSNFSHFLKIATPFIKQHAKDSNINDLLIEWGEKHPDKIVKNIVTSVIRDDKPFEKICKGNFENPDQVKKEYNKITKQVAEKLNELVQIEQLPDYEDIDKFIQEHTS